MPRTLVASAARNHATTTGAVIDDVRPVAVQDGAVEKSDRPRSRGWEERR